MRLWDHLDGEINQNEVNLQQPTSLSHDFRMAMLLVTKISTAFRRLISKRDAVITQ